MKCPKCENNKTEVVDSRKQGEKIYRRRKCPSCGNRFSTIETQVEDYRGKRSAIRDLLELAEKHEREGKQWVRLSALQAIKHLLEQ